MQHTLAATDAGQTRALPEGPSHREAAPIARNAEPNADRGNTRDVRPAPIAANLEVAPWIILRFDVTLPDDQIASRTSQIKLQTSCPPPA